MAVMSEPAESAPVSSRPRVIVSSADPEMHRRIAVALSEQGLGLSLKAEASGDLPDFDVDSATIVVLPCDVDVAREMATLRRLRREQPGPSIVAISPPTTGTGIRRALEAGADAVVFEPELELTLAVAVSAVASGQSVVPRSLRAGVERPSLSHRERQVLAFVSRGLTNAQIAEQLFLSESTVKSHLSSAFSKLGVRSRREAAALFRDLERATSVPIDPAAAEGAPA
jgi:DNA-binding NarL/FixJ family response regulator